MSPLMFVYYLLCFVFALGLLVTIHEFGHYWVARKLGVKILRFSVGFGKPLYLRHFGPDQTEFVIAGIPLGGYVKMLDEREGEVPEADLDRAFNRQNVWARIAVVIAGPLANFLFAIAAYWLVFVIGINGLKPLVGEITPGSVAEQAGLQQGYEIVRVDGVATPTWERVLHQTLDSILDAGTLPVVALDRNGFEQNLTMDLATVSVDDVSEGNFFESMGFQRFEPRYPALIGDLEAGQPAERDGLRPGDRVLEAAGEPTPTWRDWVMAIRAHPGKTLSVTVERGGETVELSLTPAVNNEILDDNGLPTGRIGALLALPPEDERVDLLGVERYGPVEAVGMAVLKTWDMSLLTLRMLGKMLIGEVSVKNISGPISIAQFAGQSASIGLVPFISFLAIVSLSLGVLNLLPVPVLDGGHLMYYLMELVLRRPLSEQAQMLGQQVGLVALLGLMLIAMYNDIGRLLQ